MPGLKKTDGTRIALKKKKANGTTGAVGMNGGKLQWRVRKGVCTERAD